MTTMMSERPGLTRMRLLLVVTLLLAKAPALLAQTVRPAVVEMKAGKHGSSGQFEIANDSLEALAVAIEAKSFVIGRDGTALFQPLQSNIHLELSETSLRLPARQSRTVYYRLTAPAYPVWFCIYSSFTPLARRPGVRVQLDLPHTVYVSRAGKAEGNALQIAGLRREGTGLHALVRNVGGDVARVTSVQALGAHTHRQEAGFPLLPGGERDVVVTDARDADTLRVSSAGGHVSAAVAPGAL